MSAEGTSRSCFTEGIILEDPLSRVLGIVVEG